MDTITADSAAGLIETLGQIDISVPLRTEGRTTEHTEKWSICRYLSTFTESFEFPISVTHQDRPDFILVQPSQKIGIEVTELVPQNEAAIDAYREKQNIEGPFALQRHSAEDVPLRRQELSARAESGENGDVWVGDSAEREWAEAAKAAIAGKIVKSQKDGFQHYDQDWLLIYNNWPVPALDQQKATRILAQSLSAIENFPFHRVVVEFSTHIWVFVHPESYMQAIVDLWKEI